MLAPSIISCAQRNGDRQGVIKAVGADHKCEGLNRVIGRAPHSASEDEVWKPSPLAPFNPQQVPRDRKEYPVWQAVLRTMQG